MRNREGIKSAFISEDIMIDLQIKQIGSVKSFDLESKAQFSDLYWL